MAWSKNRGGSTAKLRRKMTNRQEKLVQKFLEKWRQEPDSGFLKPLLHIDDVRELIENCLEAQRPT